MSAIKLTCLALKEGLDGAEDGLEKTPSGVNTAEIEQYFESDLNRKLPIIGEVNKTRATNVMFRSGRNMPVMETVEQVTDLINQAK